MIRLDYRITNCGINKKVVFLVISLVSVMGIGLSLAGFLLLGAAPSSPLRILNLFQSISNMALRVNLSLLFIISFVCLLPALFFVLPGKIYRKTDIYIHLGQHRKSFSPILLVLGLVVCFLTAGLFVFGFPATYSLSVQYPVEGMLFIILDPLLATVIPYLLFEYSKLDIWFALDGQKSHPIDYVLGLRGIAEIEPDGIYANTRLVRSIFPTAAENPNNSLLAEVASLLAREIEHSKVSIEEHKGRMKLIEFDIIHYEHEEVKQTLEENFTYYW